MGSCKRCGRKNRDESLQIFRKTASSPSSRRSHSSPSGRLFSTSSGFDRFVPVPKIEDGGDHDANAQAAEKEPAVGGQPDQQGKHQRRRDNQAGCASQIASGRFGLRIPFHSDTLASFYPMPHGEGFPRSSLRSLRLCGEKLLTAKAAKETAKDAKENIRDNSKRPACAGLA